jgi:competence protein ComEC
MKMPRPFAVLGISFFLTLVILSYLNESAAVILLCIAGISIIPLFCIKSIREQKVLPAACLSVAAACVMFLAAAEYTYKPAIALAGEKVNISGKIIDLPSKENGRFYYIIKTSSVNKKPENVKIRLSCAEPLDAEPYDSVETEATIYVLGENSEDSLQYYKTTGVYLGAYSFSGIYVKPEKKKPAMYYVINFKQSLIDNLNKLLPNENGGLVIALLFGDKSFMSDKTLANFRNIGISHIIAISGLNLSIFLLIFLDIFERIKLNKRTVYVLSMLFVILVMALAGFSASVLRAGLMLIVLLIGKLINKEADALNSIGLSVLIISALNPFGAGYIGLQLSFFATLGIVVLQKRMMKPFESSANKITHKTVRRFVKFAFETVTVTASSFVFTLPTIILTFGKVALISIVSNLMLVYSSTLSMVFGGCAALIMQFKIFAFLGNPFALVAGILAEYIIKCSEFLANIPYASVSASDTNTKLWLSGTLILFAVSVLIIKFYKINYIRLTAILCVGTLFVEVLSYNIFNHSVTKITVAAVGNASAAVISKNGKAALIGCGGDDFDVNNIYTIINKENLRSIDLLLIPRAEITESQSSDDILNYCEVKKIVAPELNYDLDYLSGSEKLELSKNKRIQLWKGAEIDYLYDDDLSCAFANLEGTTVLFIFYPGCNIQKIPQRWKKADVLICRAKLPDDLSCLNFGTIVIATDKIIKQNKVNEINIASGNAVTTVINSNVVIKSSGNSVYSVGREN